MLESTLFRVVAPALFAEAVQCQVLINLSVKLAVLGRRLQLEKLPAAVVRAESTLVRAQCPVNLANLGKSV